MRSSFKAVLCLGLFIPTLGAQAPDVVIRPVAKCEGAVCSMSREDYETLQKFHLDRLKALQEADKVMDSMQGQIEELVKRLNRLAFGCGGRA